MNTRYPGISLRRWLAPALSVAFLAACDGGPDAKPDGNRRALEHRSEGRLEALRVQVDAARNRLWVLHGDGVYVYEITTRRRIGRVGMFVGEPADCAPDLALDPSGAAIVSSNVRAVLWRLDPERFEARRHELARDTDRHKAPVRGACGLARHPNAGPGRPLVLCAAGEKGIRRIEMSPDLGRGTVSDGPCP